MGNPSSGYGPRVLNGRTFHYGTDFPAPIGSPVYTNKELTVTKAGVGTGYGNVVYAVDNAGTEYRFAHLDGFADGVKTGAVLPAGSQIGYTGITGTEANGAQTSTGAHLHYEVRRAGQAIDTMTTIDPATGKPYVNNASFEKGNNTSLRSSTAKKDPNYSPNGSAAAPASPIPNAGKPTAPKNKENKNNETPGNTRPQSIKIPRINPLLKLGD